MKKAAEAALGDRILQDMIVVYTRAKRFMHFVHKVLRTKRPSSITRTFCRLGLNFRLVAFIEKLRDFPNWVDFPHRSHFAMNQLPSNNLLDHMRFRSIYYHAMDHTFKTPDFQRCGPTSGAPTGSHPLPAASLDTRLLMLGATKDAASLAIGVNGGAPRVSSAPPFLGTGLKRELYREVRRVLFTPQAHSQGWNTLISAETRS